VDHRQAHTVAAAGVDQREVIAVAVPDRVGERPRDVDLLWRLRDLALTVEQAEIGVRGGRIVGLDLLIEDREPVRRGGGGDRERDVLGARVR
jgi:hypothetical protein